MPLISRPPKRSKIGQCLDYENFRSILRLPLEVHGENTAYSSWEPNESDTVNKQSGGSE